MRFNSGQQFVDYAAEKVRSATGSDLAGFATYNLGNGIRIALNAPGAAVDALRYGYNRSGQIGSAIYNDPLNTGIGIGKSVLNFGPEAFNGATNLVKTSLNGYSYIADAAGSSIGQNFRDTNAFNFTTQSYNGDAQLGGGIIGGVVAAVTPAAVAKLGQLGKATSVEAIYQVRYVSAYERGLAKVEADLASGAIKAPAGQPEHLFKAGRVDGIARDDLRRFAELRGDGADVVRINQRLYIDDIGDKYRIPDVYFPQSGTILDGTLGTKTLNTPQIIDFRTATGNADIGIVRPESFGGSYWIKK